MELTAGSTILHYRLAEAVGEGGMGAVWRATDEKLGRDVALKVLPEAVAGDPERRARFEREAKVLASLNHANIATLYRLEEVDGQHLLVMELVEGEDLATRIERGAMVLDEALPMALQIAEGLEAAPEWFDGFDVSEDGQRFVMIRLKPDDDTEQPSIVVTQNWFRKFSEE